MYLPLAIRSGVASTRRADAAPTFGYANRRYEYPPTPITTAQATTTAITFNTSRIGSPYGRRRTTEDHNVCDGQGERRLRSRGTGHGRKCRAVARNGAMLDGPRPG